MTDIFVAILTACVAIALLFMGYRVARILLAIWGFIIGFSAGASIFSDADGSTFLGSFLGIVLGLAFGVVLAALAYLFFKVAIIVLSAGIGYWMGSSLIMLFGIDPGFLSTTIGILVGVMVGLAAIFADFTKAYLIIGTSIAGAALGIGSLLLLFNVIPLEFFSYSTARIVIANSWFWTLGGIALTVIGVMAQYASTRDYDFDIWSPDTKTVPPSAPPAGISHHPA